MKTKTIKSIIQKKVNDWLSSIQNEETKKLLEKNIIVTGGCITSMFLKEKINDFDIYFKTYESALAAAKYYVDVFNKTSSVKNKQTGTKEPINVFTDGKRIKITVKSAGIASEGETEDYQYFETLQENQDLTTEEYVEKVTGDPGPEEEPGLAKYRPVFLSSNAITLSHKIQLVIRFYGNPEEIHENYDFVHCTNYWDSWTSDLHTNTAALECILSKELKYIGSKYPLCSIIRTRKFIGRGWTINAGQYLKMAMQLNSLDLCDVSILEDQLVGVDVHYFFDVIEKLKAKDSEKVDSNYLMKILDKVF